MMRAIRLSIYNEGRCVVSVNTSTSLQTITNFIHEKYSWILKQKTFFQERFIPFHTLKDKRSTRNEYLLKKEATRLLVNERLTYFNKMYNFRYQRVSIKNTKSRWGSCSKMGNLNFNYKLGSIPQSLADYVIVHELCHLKELNHGKDFWDLVAKAIPNYNELRRDLKKYI
jgi:predicted metal-dependent hydrolase